MPLTPRKLAHPQSPLITPPTTMKLRRKRLMPLPKHGVFMNLNRTRNSLPVAVTPRALLMVAPGERHAPMAGEPVTTPPLAHVVPIASLPHSQFSLATDQSLRPTLPRPPLTLPGPTLVATSPSCSAYAECVILLMCLSASMKRQPPPLTVRHPPSPPLRVAARSGLLTVVVNQF